MNIINLKDLLFKATIVILFTGVMYYLGNIGALDEVIYGPQDKIIKQIALEPQIKVEQFSQKMLSLQNKFTFPEDSISITPIERHINLNQRIKIIYSTLHKAPLSVHQIIDLKTITGSQSRASSWKFIQNKEVQQKLKIPQMFYIKDEHYSYQKNGKLGKLGRGAKLQLDKGHMAAAANYKSNKELIKSTNSFVNSIPQNNKNNQHFWVKFENYCRDLLKNKKCESVEIISGPIFSSDILSQEYKEYQIYEYKQYLLQKNGVVVPSRIYKIIKCNVQDGKAYASGFVIYNEEYKDYKKKKLIEFETQISEIQKSTGLLFDFKNKINGNFPNMIKASRIYENRISQRIINLIIQININQKIYLNQYIIIYLTFTIRNRQQFYFQFSSSILFFFKFHLLIFFIQHVQQLDEHYHEYLNLVTQYS